jgi:RNA polymerase sigma-70 factor (ECF subfamily)
MESEIKTKPLDSFESLTLIHEPPLYRTARALLRNDDDAREAVQETFFQAFRCFDRFEPGTNIRAWLFSILVNVVRHYRRKYLFRWQFVGDDKVFEETLRAPQEAETEISDKRILTALKLIPKAFAEVVILSDVREFSYREISDTVGVPIGTVMSRLSRGRRLLRDRLAEPASEYGVGVSLAA